MRTSQGLARLTRLAGRWHNGQTWHCPHRDDTKPGESHQVCQNLNWPDDNRAWPNGFRDVGRFWCAAVGVLGRAIANDRQRQWSPGRKGLLVSAGLVRREAGNGHNTQLDQLVRGRPRNGRIVDDGTLAGDLAIPSEADGLLGKPLADLALKVFDVLGPEAAVSR